MQVKVPFYFGTSLPVSFHCTSRNTAAVVFNTRTLKPDYRFGTFYWDKKTNIKPQGEAFLDWVETLKISERTKISPLSWNWSHKCMPLYHALGFYEDGGRKRAVYSKLFNDVFSISLDSIAFMYLKICGDNEVKIPFRDISYKNVSEYFRVDKGTGRFGKCLEYIQLYQKMMDVSIPIYGIK